MRKPPMRRTPWSRFLKVAVLGDAAVVELTDETLGEPYRPWLLGLVRDMRGRQVHMDFEGVRSLPASSIATLLLLQKKAKATGSSLRLFNLSPLLYAILAATQLTKVLDVRVRKAE
jgi:anti-anti-sigma regulatory factor